MNELEERASQRLTAAMVGLLRSFSVNVFSADEPYGKELVRTVNQERRPSRQVVDEVKQHLPDKLFETVIPRTVRLSEAPSFGKTIFEYDNLNPGATAYRNLAKEIIGRFGLGAG